MSMFRRLTKTNYSLGNSDPILVERFTSNTLHWSFGIYIYIRMRPRVNHIKDSGESGDLPVNSENLIVSINYSIIFKASA